MTSAQSLLLVVVGKTPVAVDRCTLTIDESAHDTEIMDNS